MGLDIVPLKLHLSGKRYWYWHSGKFRRNVWMELYFVFKVFHHEQWNGTYRLFTLAGPMQPQAAISCDTPVRVHGGKSTALLYEGGRSPREGGRWRGQSVIWILGTTRFWLASVFWPWLQLSTVDLCFRVTTQNFTITRKIINAHNTGIEIAEIVGIIIIL